VSLQPRKHPFGITIFLSAFLLFWVQLLLGKYILPWFGGAAAVWTSCMLFFQVLLLAGYAYAHWLTNRFKARAQSLVHCAVVASSLLLLCCLALIWNSPITPGSSWKPHGVDPPIIQIVTLLSVSVGLPFFVLSSTGPLLQAWHWRVHGGGSAYRLYSLSNLGSFLSLLAFPVLFEPALTLNSQAWLWASAYLAFTVFVCKTSRGVASSRLEIGPQEVVSTVNAGGPRPSKGSYLLWGGLSACASIVFLATTNQICQDIGVVPLLWIVPLGVYLISFVICFEHEGWYSRKWFHLAFGLAMWAACFVLYDGAVSSIFAQIAIYTAVLFVLCMVCNGELAHSKPHPTFLTSFYLTVAAGGAFGGIFVGLISPHIFKGFWEYQVGPWTTALLLLITLVRDKESWLYRGKLASPIVVVAIAALLPETAALTITKSNNPASHFSAFVALALIAYAFSNRNRNGSTKAREKAAPAYCVAALLLTAIAFGGTAFAHVANALAVSRNFYGVLAVVPRDLGDPTRSAYCLKHGRIVHGCQLRAKDDRQTPTTYFGPASGVGVAILHAASATSRFARGRLRIGIVGLGVGTIAAYGKPGDILRFYEINPDVIRIASDQRYFGFLSDSPARIEMIPGDGRLSLEHEFDLHEHQDFDVLVIDAFSGDAVPVHLLTLEAFKTYIRSLRRSSGILAVHITNSYLDLRPVVFAAARRLGLQATWVHSAGDGGATSASNWVLLSTGNNLPELDANGNGLATEPANVLVIRPWTDDYSNLVQILYR